MIVAYACDVNLWFGIISQYYANIEAISIGREGGLYYNGKEVVSYSYMSGILLFNNDLVSGLKSPEEIIPESNILKYEFQKLAVQESESLCGTFFDFGYFLYKCCEGYYSAICEFSNTDIMEFVIKDIGGNNPSVLVVGGVQVTVYELPEKMWLFTIDKYVLIQHSAVYKSFSKAAKPYWDAKYSLKPKEISFSCKYRGLSDMVSTVMECRKNVR